MARHNYTGKLLELNVISAQDLAAVSKSMRTYTVAWIDPERKLTTRVDENGHANPKWNEKFIFRVNDDVLDSDAMVMIEIYALTWLRVVLIGTVYFHISTLIPHSSRPKTKPSAAAGGGAATMTQFATLQIRRPSGRPQGTLNIGVAIVSSTMRSMPLQSDLTTSTLTYGGDSTVEPNSNTPRCNVSQDGDPKSAGRPNLRRTQSEMTSDKLSYNHPGSVINESTLYPSQLGLKTKGGGGSQLGSLVSSDVGPSASVVAAAIAKGLYPRPNDDGGSSILDNWTEQNSVEGLKSKIERWRKEMPPAYNRENRKSKAGSIVGKDLPPAPPRRRHSDGGSGLFSCFGNAYGCEFSISCGGAGKKNARYVGGGN